MPIERINGADLYYQSAGGGTVPIVLVHGSWGSHEQWDDVASGLAGSHPVVSYDRRGHSQSVGDTGTVHDNVNDLVALIDTLGLAPTFVAGNSYGSIITLRLAATRPDVVRGIMLHEPPLFSLLADDPELAPLRDGAVAQMGSVLERIASGDAPGATDQFMTELALAPGEWEQLSESFRQTAIRNAPAFLGEATNNPDGLEFDLELIRSFTGPVLLTVGAQSPPGFPPVLDKLAKAIPQAERVTFAGAGHLPHVTHPEAYVEATASFMRAHAH